MTGPIFCIDGGANIMYG
jgi:hypothetical protein